MLTFLGLLELHGQLSLESVDLVVLVLVGLDEPSVVLSSFSHSSTDRTPQCSGGSGGGGVITRLTGETC